MGRMMATFQGAGYILCEKMEEGEKDEEKFG